MEQHEVKVFAGILGVVQAALHTISGFLLYKSRDEFEDIREWLTVNYVLTISDLF